MRIEHVKLDGFRNFRSAKVRLAEKTLFVGANDVGKTNLLYALRLLLDRSISDRDLEPLESDFHVGLDGNQVDVLRIEVKLSDIKEDAVISKLKGYCSDAGVTFILYEAWINGLTYKISIGHSLEALEEIEGRFFLKHVHFKYVESSRNLEQYIQREKRHLLKIAKHKRTAEQVTEDETEELDLQNQLDDIQEGINGLNYVADATKTVNVELEKLAHHHTGYEVSLEAQSLNFSAFVERLHLGASAGGRSVGVGGDGRNNQILVGLWKAKCELEHDSDNEAVIFCIEEPEAHLHPHQQRKLASYLGSSLKGQVLVTTHSPQIASQFAPTGIARLVQAAGETTAAGGGCSDCLEEGWKNLGYRLSVVPAEAFFADAVLLVEGPSETQFYHKLAEVLKIDLDYQNVSIVAVDGIDFKVYVKIFDALGISCILRTDNDVTKVPRSKPTRWRYTGLNRARRAAGLPNLPDMSVEPSAAERIKEWAARSPELAKNGIYIARLDLENDLAEVCGDEMKKVFHADDVPSAVAFLQHKKALRMGSLLRELKDSLAKADGHPLAEPLKCAMNLARERNKIKYQNPML